MPDPSVDRPVSAPRVLIVEDEFLIALAAESDLEAEGFAVVGKAATYEKAVDLARATRPDLILMDVRLGAGRDGIEAAIAIRRELDVPVVFATGSINAENIHRAEAAQPAGWLAKPYTSDELLAVLRTAISALRQTAHSAG